jgi:hypothetical protein
MSPDGQSFDVFEHECAGVEVRNQTYEVGDQTIARVF